MAAAAATTRNGVNVDQLVGTIDAIKKDPSLAAFTFRAHTDWEGGGRVRTRIRGFSGAGQEDVSRTEDLILIGDEPPVLLGTNSAPNASRRSSTRSPRASRSASCTTPRRAALP